MNERLWKENREVKELLLEAGSLEEAREKLYSYLFKQEQKLREDEESKDFVEHSLALQALSVFKGIISKRNEKIAGFSTLETIYNLAQGKIDSVSPGFVKEIIHLFRAIHKKAGYESGWLGKKIGESTEFHGREGAIKRSNYLDKIYQNLESFVSRYRDGLDPEVIKEREENKKKILSYFKGSEEDWYDWNWQLRHVIRGEDGIKHLKNLVPLTDEDIEALELASKYKIPYGITPYYLSLFDFSRADRKYDYQVRAQVLPPLFYVKMMAEHRSDRSYYFDFMGEHDTSPHDLITRRYPLVAIVKPYNSCPQICVYCQRNWEITGPLEPSAAIPESEYNKAIDWLVEHPAIKDVLITGGDPLVLSDQKIDRIIERLFSRGTVILVRIASRVLVTLPMRITDSLVEVFKKYIKFGERTICFVTHVEHPMEITPDVIKATEKLTSAGIYIYNQLVYTAVVSRRFENVALRIALKKAGIDPYYTFFPKGKEEHKGYTIPVARIFQERKEEARLLPGQFRTDEPVFNVPRLGKNHIRAMQDRELIGIKKDGRRVYLWYPWEKGITYAKPYKYVDVSIDEYLEEMKKMGEDPEDYSSIWYYY